MLCHLHSCLKFPQLGYVNLKFSSGPTMLNLYTSGLERLANDLEANDLVLYGKMARKGRYSGM